MRKIQLSEVEKVKSQVNEEYLKLAKKYKLNPTWLREIVELRNRGFNHIQIAHQLGISRETVASYLKKLRNMDREDLWKIIIAIGIILGGSYLIAKLLDFLFKKED